MKAWSALGSRATRSGRCRLFFSLHICMGLLQLLGVRLYSSTTQPAKAKHGRCRLFFSHDPPIISAQEGTAVCFWAAPLEKTWVSFFQPSCTQVFSLPVCQSSAGHGGALSSWQPRGPFKPMLTIRQQKRLGYLRSDFKSSTFRFLLY